MNSSIIQDKAVVLNEISKSFSFNKTTDTFKALKNISFSLEKGEVLGLIGKNGSGKSTLLKILADVLTPSSGEISFKGKITSILEVGSGFHPDMSGIDNVLLNASLLGLSSTEIKERLPQITQFADIGDFLDRPIKTYSQGMYLRLAFSTAIHLNPDILLLDEVIAVGDNEFRDKCNKKISELVNRGLTIIVVSHNMSQILEFCTRCIWLDKGEIKMDGIPIDVVEKYILEYMPKNDYISNVVSEISPSNFADYVIIKNIEIISESNLSVSEISAAENFRIKCTCEKKTDIDSLEIAISITNLDGVKIFIDSFALRNDYNYDTIVKKGIYEIICSVPGRLLNRGVYKLSLFICRSFERIGILDDIVIFKVSLPENTSIFETYFNKMNVAIAPRLEWKISQINE